MSYRFRLNENGIRRFRENNLRPFMVDLAREIKVEAEILAPKASGALANSIETSVSPPGSEDISIEVRATDPKARMVHQGTRPHVIARRNASALFNGPAGFGPVAGPVNHPGTRPNPFLRRALSIALIRHGLRG